MAFRRRRIRRRRPIRKARRRRLLGPRKSVRAPRIGFRM